MSKKSTVVVPEVIESKGEVATTLNSQLSTFNSNRDGIVKTIARQIEAVRGAELRSTFEKLKLGAMVKQAVTLLGLDSKGGRGHGGDGVRGWWDENFKGKDGQPLISYWTLMKWISAAERLPALIGGSQAADPDGVMKLLAKDPEKVVGKEAKILKSAEKVANGMTMRQMLLWGDDEEAQGKRGRPKGSGAGPVEYKKKSSLECAADEVWPVVQHMLKHRGAMFTAYKILPDEKLSEFRDTLTEHVKAIEAVLAARGQ